MLDNYPFPEVLIAVLGILALLDFVAADLASRVIGSAEAPMSAIAVMVIVGVPPSDLCHPGSRLVRSPLGLGDRPSAAPAAIGAVTLVLSVAVIVVLARTPAHELTPAGGWSRRPTVPGHAGIASIRKADNTSTDTKRGAS